MKITKLLTKLKKSNIDIYIYKYTTMLNAL